MTTDKVVLDFENAEVRNSDYESLKPEGWLTGEIINFYWTYLELREFRTEPSVLFLGTYTAYRISNAESASVTDNISMQLSDELGEQRQLILIPLNHRSHWSLLVYCRLTRTFYHYDSISKYNRDFAERAASRFLRVLEPLLKSGFYFKSMQTPQQNNDYDCGIYVLAIAEELARRFINIKRRDRNKRSKRLEQGERRYKAERPNAGRADKCMAQTMTSSMAAAHSQQLQSRRNHSTPPVSRVPVSTRSVGTSPVSTSLSNPSPGRALASDLLMPRFGQTFTGFQSPFSSLYSNQPSEFLRPEPLLKGGGSTGSAKPHHSSKNSRSREERLKMEEEMMEKAGLPRDFWLVTVEDIEYPHCMRRRIRSLVLELRGKV
ncbi:SUMO1 sentrin specific peptidase 8 [Coemansia sp. RSA 989]|nr:SUMO1 sentrin specific peptidase 8 [Coemansia sp. RSA 1086]KAJ1748655.1 SUMO1 sentrin specific peptidase 8 [Coemansia sp. RSA 1821]KAJ1863705.1 SUMO1 sentrin specific peptidase 8 [Coemansia sp. RSA 989]KAJ1871516.1 SUMO1 sentrin specific peptidase 8 [Coemansia sp. RSA 990]KAJ2647002.1 SUMO1 sentrin specific peptidase 8 [Coemansia sp. RSA 1250]KAJ2668830.1 SUMO1 sentrin specific peptidase 8 [Coemansia sp. RSA 1085]